MKAHIGVDRRGRDVGVGAHRPCNCAHDSCTSRYQRPERSLSATTTVSTGAGRR
jgi:hypothetical protein